MASVTHDNRDTISEGRPPFRLDYVLQILKIVWKCSPRLTLIRLLLVLIMAVLPLVPMYLLKMLVDAIATGGEVGANYYTLVLLAFSLSKLLSVVLGNYAQYVQLLQADIVSDHISRIVIQKSIDIEYAYYDSDNYHDTLQRAIGQAGSQPLNTLNNVVGLVQNIISLTAIAILLVSFHWFIIVLLVFVAIPVAIIRWRYTNKVVRLREQQTQLERKSGYLRQILSQSQNAKEVRVFGYGRRLLSEFLGLRKTLRAEKRQLHGKRLFVLSIGQGAEALAILAALGYIVYLAFDGQMSPGDVVLYYQIFQRGQSNIAGTLNSLVTINENQLYLTHLFTFLALDNTAEPPGHPAELIDGINRIELVDVTFQYPLTQMAVLRGVNLVLERGSLTAIVGENGSGKSTIVKLLCRLYEPTEGQILVNGQDIRLYRVEDIRREISSIFQDFSRYNATAEQNIHYADYDKTLDTDRLSRSVSRSGAESFVTRLPRGIKTTLGRSFRQGEELSGGQWQKLALARSLYKDASLLILDEPSSHIDPLSEHDIFQALKAEAEDKLVLLISHRIYNLKIADRIIVMEDGQVIESGTHEGLISHRNRYYEMFMKQK